jgi:phospholipase C
VGGGPVLGNDELGYSWKTYPERLDRAGISWKIYQDIGDGLDAAGGWGWIEDAYRGNYGDNSLLYFNQYRTASPGNPLYDKARTGTNVKQGQGYFDILMAGAGPVPGLRDAAGWPVWPRTARADARGLTVE